MCHINSFVFAAFILLLIQATRGLTNSGNTCHGGLYNWPFCNALDRSTRNDVRLENSNRSSYRESVRSREPTFDERRVFDLNRINRERYSPAKSRSLHSFTLQNRRLVVRVDSRQERENDRAFEERLLESRRIETRENRREANDRRDESRRNIRDRFYERRVSRERRVTDENRMLTKVEIRDSRNEVGRDSVNNRLVERRDTTDRETREYSTNIRNIDSRADSERRSLNRMDARRLDSREVDNRETRASSEYRAAERRGENIRSDRQRMIRGEDNYRVRNKIRDTSERIIYVERLENKAVFRKDNQDSLRLSRTRSRLNQANVIVRGDRNVREREPIKTLTDVKNMERSRIALGTKQIKTEDRIPHELTLAEAKESTKNVLITVTRVVCFAVMVLQIYLAGRSTKTKQRFLSAIPFFQSTKLKEE